MILKVMDFIVQNIEDLIMRLLLKANKRLQAIHLQSQLSPMMVTRPLIKVMDQIVGRRVLHPVIPAPVQRAHQPGNLSLSVARNILSILV